MLFFVLVFGFGLVSGLRALTALTVVSWAARLGRLPLAGSWLAFIGYSWTPWILTVAAFSELVNDKLPKTPSRKVPVQFGTRIVMGALTGAAIGVPKSMMLAGLAVGAAGAVAGTLLGAFARGRLAQAIGGKDLPIALLEDLTAIGLSLLLFQWI